MKIYGPYIRPDGRKHVVLYEHGYRTTMSYPKFLMEKHLNRKLENDEVVHHINHDTNDNRITNLEVKLKDEHYRLHSAEAEGVTTITFNCPECGKEATKLMSNVKHNLNRGKSGPFCGRSCAGKHSSRLQYSK